MSPFFATLWRWLNENPLLTLAVWFQVALAVFALVAMPFDKRLILGISPWVKPLKFDLSVIIFLVTMAGVLSGLQGYERARWWIGGGMGVALALENSIISLQSLRGVRSHMNFSTPLDAYLFSSMAALIAINTVLVAVTLGLVSIDGTLWPPAVTWGVRLGLAALLAGSMEGLLIVAKGGHTVGAADGLPGLPFVNWSRKHGDLRVAHFFALHALQAFPFLGWALSRTSLPVPVQITFTFAGAAAYLGAVWLLFKQALAGRPLLG